MARFNQGIYNAIISMGGSAASANNAARARRPGRAFRRFQAAFVPPQPAAPTPASPPMPQASQYRAPTPTNATLGALDSGVRSPNKKRERTTLASLRIRPKRRVNQALTAGSAAGTGLNIG
jgi:hypothetical protein